jgi:transposase-like protein
MKRRQNSHITLAEKWEIIQDIERGLSRMEVALRHGVSKSAVNDASRIRDEIKAYHDAGRATWI